VITAGTLSSSWGCPLWGVIADVKNSGFAHAPSGHFQANAAWLALAALAHNLTRAAGALASAFHARATTATIRDRLINVPARLARSARRLTLHLPERWPWSEDFTQLFRDGACTAGPLTLPDRPARKGPRPVDRVEELGRPAATPCPNPQLRPNTACTTPKRSTGNQAGGSGLSKRTVRTSCCMSDRTRSSVLTGVGPSYGRGKQRLGDGVRLSGG
jgi:hypothetical protein